MVADEMVTAIGHTGHRDAPRGSPESDLVYRGHGKAFRDRWGLRRPRRVLPPELFALVGGVMADQGQRHGPTTAVMSFTTLSSPVTVVGTGEDDLT